jgi:hypothetical protein
MCNRILSPGGPILEIANAGWRGLRMQRRRRALQSNYISLSYDFSETLPIQGFNSSPRFCLYVRWLLRNSSKRCVTGVQTRETTRTQRSVERASTRKSHVRRGLLQPLSSSVSYVQTCHWALEDTDNGRLQRLLDLFVKLVQSPFLIIHYERLTSEDDCEALRQASKGK